MSESTLGELQIGTLRLLKEGLIPHDFVLIGASALLIHLAEYAQATEDLDLAIASPSHLVTSAVARLQGWRRDSKQEQAWISPEGVHVDILAMGAEDLLQGRLRFPESGFEMSVAGFRHVFDRAESLLIAPDLSIRVVDLSTLTLLKSNSFLDSHGERMKDLRDLAIIFERYVDESDDRRYSDDVVAAGVPFEGVPAYLLGRDLRDMCSTSELQVLLELIALVERNTTSMAARAAMMRGISDAQASTLDLVLASYRRGLTG